MVVTNIASEAEKKDDKFVCSNCYTLVTHIPYRECPHCHGTVCHAERIESVLTHAAELLRDGWKRQAAVRLSEIRDMYMTDELRYRFEQLVERAEGPRPTSYVRSNVVKIYL
jgi:hypothetical protein